MPYGSPKGKELLSSALKLLWERRECTSASDAAYSRLRSELDKVVMDLDDLKEEFLWGRVSSFHMGKFKDKFELMMNPAKPSHGRLREYQCIRAQMESEPIWRVLKDIVQGYEDNELHGHHDLNSKQLGLKRLYDVVSRLSFDAIYVAIKDANAKLSFYRDFARFVADTGEETVIVNLNYDDLLDQAILELEPGLAQYVFGDGVLTYPVERRNFAATIKVFKPHGSFNFVCCSKCGNITLREGIAWETSAQRFEQQRRCASTSCPGSGKDPCFIPYCKANTLTPLRRWQGGLLTKVEHTLQGLSEITALGYSFEVEDNELIDDHLRFLFEGRVTTVVAKNAAESIDIRNCLNSVGLSARDTGFGGFEGFVRSVAHDVG